MKDKGVASLKINSKSHNMSIIENNIIDDQSFESKRIYHLDSDIKNELSKYNLLKTNNSNIRENQYKLLQQKIIIEHCLELETLTVDLADIRCTLSKMEDNGYYSLNVNKIFDNKYGLFGVFDSTSNKVYYNEFSYIYLCGEFSKSGEYNFLYEDNIVYKIIGPSFSFESGCKPEYKDCIDEDIKFCFIDDNHRNPFNKVLDLVCQRLGTGMKEMFELADKTVKIFNNKRRY